MQSFLDGNEYEIEKIAREKKQRIDNEIGNDKTFSETNHCFIKLKFPFRRNKLMDRCNIPRLKIPAFITNYELDCLRWYVDEIAAMTHVFKKKYPGISYYEIDLDDLNNTCTVEDMLLNFGLRSNAVVNELIGKPTNQR